MEVAEMEQALKVLDSSLSLIKWRLKSPSKRRLEIDILALCTGMRAAVMLDYGGRMPELQERLCALVKLIQKESPIFEHLRVMVIEDMVYLIHVGGLAEHVKSSLSSEAQLHFVDLEHDPPKMITQSENNPLGMELASVQKLFSQFFHQDEMKDDLLSCRRPDSTVDTQSSTNELLTSQSSDFINLSSLMQDTQITVPTLNGWLLGYPVVYLFRKEHIADATWNLSSKSLRIFKISVCRNAAPSKGSQQEELLREIGDIFRRVHRLCTGCRGMSEEERVRDRIINSGGASYDNNYSRYISTTLKGPRDFDLIPSKLAL